MLLIECLNNDNEKDIMELSELYLEAFDDNGVYRYIFPKSTGFADDGLRWLFERRICMFLACGAVYKICKDSSTGQIIGGVGCLYSAHLPGLTTMMWYGILLWPFLWGFDSLLRALEMNDCKSKDGVGDSKAWDAQLVMMAVKPTHQGRGVGHMLVENLLAEVDKDETCRTIGLTTQKEVNLRFYSHHGFDEVDHIEMKGFNQWTLVRVRPNCSEE